MLSTNTTLTMARPPLNAHPPTFTSRLSQQVLKNEGECRRKRPVYYHILLLPLSCLNSTYLFTRILILQVSPANGLQLS